MGRYNVAVLSLQEKLNTAFALPHSNLFRVPPYGNTVKVLVRIPWGIL